MIPERASPRPRRPARDAVASICYRYRPRWGPALAAAASGVCACGCEPAPTGGQQLLPEAAHGVLYLVPQTDDALWPEASTAREECSLVLAMPITEN